MEENKFENPRATKYRNKYDDTVITVIKADKSKTWIYDCDDGKTRTMRELKKDYVYINPSKEEKTRAVKCPCCEKTRLSAKDALKSFCPVCKKKQQSLMYNVNY